ncbi:MAG TPA: hypothetical protein VN316_00750 [candidate division Zixibacteria bacterium]|nr:hypothetical protein [candidate division Zixibacteria bacterium]
MSSFINDENGVIEPYADLTAMALAVAGFIIFFAIVAQAYTSYQQKAFIAEHYQDAAALAEKLSRDSALTVSSHPDMIDAGRVEEISGDPQEMMKKYGGYYDFLLKVEANSDVRDYSVIIKDPRDTESNTGISASIPVTVRINEVQEIPGTLTVKIWRK